TLEGKVGHRWYLWAVPSAQAVVFLLDPGRAHDGNAIPGSSCPCPESSGCFGAGSCARDRLDSSLATGRVSIGGVRRPHRFAPARRHPMNQAPSLPEPGQVVRVRQRQYLVEEVVVPLSAADMTLVRLACLDDDAQGQELQALWEAELDAAVLTGSGWDHLAARGFDPPRLFSAYLHTLRWNCVTATNPRLFQAPFRAGIRIDAYQIEPLRQALLLPRVNLFIADAVGLGKTIEAGLIARELLLRKKVRDIVVACPPSVLPQWQDELEQRFGLGFEVLDREYVVRVRRERGYGTNP